MSSLYTQTLSFVDFYLRVIWMSFSTPRNTSQQLAAWDTICSICVGYFVLGAFTMISGLVFDIHAQYGRFSSFNKSIKVPGKIAWIVQEFPSFAVASFFLWRAQQESLETVPIANRLLLFFFIVHYVNRTFIYPLRLRGGKDTPLLEFVMAALFTMFNGLLQGLCLTQYDEYKHNEVYHLHFMFGIVLFICGFAINLHSDSILRNLRKPNETGYKIPYGGAFDLVTAANYFGEFVEWMGFAIAGNNAGGYAFAMFTFSNLFPRAYHVCLHSVVGFECILFLFHIEIAAVYVTTQIHRWYHQKFKGEYPRDRKIMIPFLL